jgi:hypothetical protein
MKNLLKFSALVLIVGLVLGFAGCGGDDKDDKDDGDDGIKWTGDPNGTLTVVNNSPYDMVVFIGKTITKNGILGGVRTGKTLTLDVSNMVDDFQTGGYMVIRAVRLEEYQKNQNNLSLAKVDYSAMATYGAGKKYRAELISTTDGDFSYVVQNRSDYGLELRLNSMDGEKLAYLSPKQVRYPLFSSTNDAITLFPVYVAYNTRSQSIVTFAPKDEADHHDVQPRAIGPSVQEYDFPPADRDLAILFGAVTLPFATITVQNNATRDSSFCIGTSTRKAESNYTLVSSGQLESYEIPATQAGQQLALNCGLLTNTVRVPVRFEGETENPVIKNGYIYQVTLTYNGSGGVDLVASYTATIVEIEAINTDSLLIAQ